MTVFVALLRAVNVGGTGTLPMKDLVTLCTSLGFEHVRTYIQSGNVVFESARAEAEVGADLERALAERMGKRIDVAIRTATALRATLAANPFPDAQPAQVGVLFLFANAPTNLLEGLRIPGREQVCLVGREIFIHYPDGMGRSKLKLPPTAAGTIRNLNTVARLVAMAEAQR